MNQLDLDALALEYKRDYGTARRSLDVRDLVNNPTANRKCRIFGLSLPEQGADLLGGERSTLLNDRADPLLVTQDCIKSLA
jgi:hypothetical protein